MNGWQRWLQAPQTHWLRKLLFQLHLWLGIGFGLYVLAISLSGSALLLKYRMYEWFEPKYLQQEPAADAVPLEGDALMTRMAEVYAGFLEQTDYNVGRVIESIRDPKVAQRSPTFGLAMQRLLAREFAEFADGFSARLEKMTSRAAESSRDFLGLAKARPESVRKTPVLN
jgi:hypothetical protein